MTFDTTDYILISIIALLVLGCLVCCAKEKYNYAALAEFSVKDPKYSADSQNVMSAPIVYRVDGNEGGQTDGRQPGQFNPPNPSGGVVVPRPDWNPRSREGFQYAPADLTKTLVPAHLVGSTANPLGSPWNGFLPGGEMYGVSAPPSNLSATVSSNSSPGSLNIYSTII